MKLFKYWIINEIEIMGLMINKDKLMTLNDK